WSPHERAIRWGRAANRAARRVSCCPSPFRSRVGRIMLGGGIGDRQLRRGTASRRAMLSLRSHALITGGIFAALLAIGWGGNLLDAFGLVPHDRGIQIAVLALMLGLWVGLAFSAGPLTVLLGLGFQVP